MKSFIFPVILCIIIASCSTTPIPKNNSDPVVVPQDFFGIVHAGRLRTAEEYQLLNELGAVWLLDTFRWNSIEPVRGGGYDYSRYDPFVNIANEYGHKVIAVIGYHTNWTAKVSGKINYVPKQFYEEYLNHIEALIIHFKGRVHAWQVWNEPNIIFWRGSNKEYYELAKLVSQKIRATDPDAFIIGGGFFRVPDKFILNMHKSGAMENFDALSFHSYGVNPEGSIKVYENFIKVMSKIDFNGDVWITETGYPTGGYYPSKVSLKIFPSYIIKTITGSAARGAKVLMWYEIYDRNKDNLIKKIDSENYFGLAFRDDYSKKAGAWAYELCAHYLPGSEYVPELPKKENIPNSIVTFCFLNSNGSNTLIMWNDKKRKQKIKISIPGSFNVHNISTGESSSFSDEIILNITNEPVFITWKGSSDINIKKAL